MVDPQPLEYYYKDLSGAYGGLDETSGREPYSKERLDGLFATAPGTRYSSAPVHSRLGYTSIQIDDALKASRTCILPSRWGGCWDPFRASSRYATLPKPVC